MIRTINLALGVICTALAVGLYHFELPWEFAAYISLLNFIVAKDAQ